MDLLTLMQDGKIALSALFAKLHSFLVRWNRCRPAVYVLVSSRTNNTAIERASGTQDNCYKSGTIPEILGQLEPIYVVHTKSAAIVDFYDLVLKRLGRRRESWDQSHQLEDPRCQT